MSQKTEISGKVPGNFSLAKLIEAPSAVSIREILLPTWISNLCLKYGFTVKILFANI